MTNSKVAFNSIDEYIATFPEGTQKVLTEIRATIKVAVQDAKEKISYQMAALELSGKNLIYFAGWKMHVSICPIPPDDETFEKEIAKYTTGKGTLQFPLDKPLPMKLISRIVKYGVADNLKNTKKNVEGV